MRYLLVALLLGGLFLATPALASGQLVKSDQHPAVYYVDENNIRHTFPNGKIYKTWYRTFSGIEVLSQTEIEKMKLGKNVHARPGTSIVTFKTDPNYYAVEPGGVLRSFDSEEIISAMYGSKWQTKVVELQDGFFDDYIIDAKIKDSKSLPDGVVYKSILDGMYYFKYDDLARPFENLDAIFKNKFQRSDILNVNFELNKREKPITDMEDYVFNPAGEIIPDNRDCENKDFKAVMVLVSKDGVSSKELEKLNSFKRRLEQNFKWATKELATIDVRDSVVILENDDYLYEGNSVANEAINIFYDKYNDEYDFIILYNDFVADEPVMANYLTITNSFRGTGNHVFASGNIFGSFGKLKGVANMGNLNKYSNNSSNTIDSAVNYIIHELGHHFTGRARFLNSNGAVDYSLLHEDRSHWSEFVDFESPIGEFGWQDNGNGTYTKKASLSHAEKKSFSDLDLYFMGLLPKPTIDPIRYIVTDEGESGNTVAGEMAEVSIDQIVETMGEWRCRL